MTVASSGKAATAATLYRVIGRNFVAGFEVNSTTNHITRHAPILRRWISRSNLDETLRRLLRSGFTIGLTDDASLLTLIKPPGDA